MHLLRLQLDRSSHNFFFDCAPDTDTDYWKKLSKVLKDVQPRFDHSRIFVCRITY